MVSEEKKEVSVYYYLIFFLIYVYKLVVLCLWLEEVSEWIMRECLLKWFFGMIINFIVVDGCYVVSEVYLISVNLDIEFMFCFGVVERIFCNEVLSRD